MMERVSDEWLCNMIKTYEVLNCSDDNLKMYSALQELQQYRAMIKAIARRGDPGEKAQVPKNEFGAPERVSDEWLAWAIAYGRRPVWIAECLQELQERREEEKHSTPKLRLERNIKGVFERDFNDLSIKQLGEIANIIMDCDECPIFDCIPSKNQKRCNVVFEDALRAERRGNDGKSK